jgi:hypothetical protein
MIMAKHQKTKCTEIKDLPVEEKELGVEEASKVRGEQWGVLLYHLHRHSRRTPTSS